MKAPDAAPTPALDWLFGLQRFGVKPGLGPMRALLAALGAPAERYSSVLVAGTNGKGSVAHTLAAALVAPDRTVGLYTSPHLQRVGERVVVDGRETDADRLEATVAALRPTAERLGNTFFEVMTAAALVSFADAAVDVAVLEVGLGGRLDATNVVTPVLSVITSVGLDHTAVLGDDLAQIAFEKAGIMRPGVPVVSGVTEPAAATVVAARAAGLGAPLLEYGAGFWGEVSGIGWDGSEFVWRHPGATQDGAWVRTPLVGRHQVANVAVALEAAVALGVEPGRAVAAVAAAGWPGRLESFWCEGRRVVLDGAHNPAGARALARAIEELTGEVAVLVVGASADKDVPGIVAALAPRARRLVVTAASNSPRAVPASDLAAWLPGAVAAPGVGAALRAALDLSAPGDTVVVAGSLFLVGEARDLLSGAVPERRQRWQ